MNVGDIDVPTFIFAKQRPPTTTAQKVENIIRDSISNASSLLEISTQLANDYVCSNIKDLLEAVDGEFLVWWELPVFTERLKKLSASEGLEVMEALVPALEWLDTSDDAGSGCSYSPEALGTMLSGLAPNEELREFCEHAGKYAEADGQMHAQFFSYLIRIVRNPPA